MYGKPPYKPGDPEGFNVLRTDYVETVRKVAREEAVTLVDAYVAFQEHGRQPGQTVDELFLDDGHPNTKGQRLLADLLLPAVETAAKTTSPSKPSH